MKNNNQSDEEFVASLQRMMKMMHQKDIPKENLLRITELTKLLLEIVQDRFVCSKCKTEYRIVFLGKEQK